MFLAYEQRLALDFCYTDKFKWQMQSRILAVAESGSWRDLRTGSNGLNPTMLELMESEIWDVIGGDRSPPR